MASKMKIIISDLHLGAGFVPDNPLEDFVTDDEFAEFLGMITAESDEKTMDVELIVNGDMIEFLQVPATDVFNPRHIYPSEMYRLSSETASINKVALVIEGHLTFFAALRNFINPADPHRQITIIKGNHDVNLHWAAVQDVIREAIGATGDRRGLLAFEKRQVSREGIYVEHGNQYVEKVNRFDNFEEPFDPKRPGELETPPGSVFVIDFFNDVEREKWWLDAVKPITSLIWYCFALDFAFAARLLVNFLRVAPILVVGSFPVEDESGIVAQMDQLRQQMEDEDEVAALGERYATDEVFRREFNTRVDQMMRVVEAWPSPEKALPITLEKVRESEAMDNARDIAELTEISLRQMAQTKIVEEHVQVVVFGHTHQAICEQLDGGMYLNSGTWVWWRDFAGTDIETWKEFYAHPDRFTRPHYLAYVRVDYDEENHPCARLLDYTGQLVVECASPPECGFVAWLRMLWEKLVGLFR